MAKKIAFLMIIGALFVFPLLTSFAETKPKVIKVDFANSSP